MNYKPPDWAKERTIYIFAGTELLAVKECIVTHEKGKHVYKYKPMKIKVSRCSGCGECCKGCPFASGTGCRLGNNIPFGCAKSICTSFEGCTELFEEVN